MSSERKNDIKPGDRVCALCAAPLFNVYSCSSMLFYILVPSIDNYSTTIGSLLANYIVIIDCLQSI